MFSVCIYIYYITMKSLPLSDPQQPCLPELFDEVCVNLSVLLPLLLLLLSQSIAGVYIAIARDTGKYCPKEQGCRNTKLCYNVSSTSHIRITSFY